MDLTIVIVSYNSRDHLRNCLQSITEFPPSGSHEILVVDNDSKDGTAEMVQNEFRKVQFIAKDRNLGFSAANNVGIKASQGDLILLLNNDTEVLDGSIDSMMKLFRERPKTGVVGCKLVNRDGSVQISFGNLISIYNELIQKFLAGSYARGLPLISRYLEWRSNRSRQPHWVSGACLMVRRETVEDAGYMDERFFMYTEEVDLCHRIRQRGWEIHYTPHAIVRHIGGVSTRSNRPKTIREYRRSQLYFYEKHHGRFQFLILKGYLLIKLLVRLVCGQMLTTKRSRSEDGQTKRKLNRELLQLVWRYRYRRPPVQRGVHP